jgi:vacuolar-type H+-ATPase subunit I/STV1
MTRVFIVGPVDVQEETVRLLQTLGAVHVEPASEMAGEFERKHGAVVARVKKLDRVMADLARFKDRRATARDDHRRRSDGYAEEILLTYQDMELRVQSLERLKTDLTPWGNFDLSHIHALEAAGLAVRRYRMEASRWEEFQPPENVLVEVVARKRDVMF